MSALFSVTEDPLFSKQNPIQDAPISEETGQQLTQSSDNEEARQSALDSYQILDTPSESDFDDLVRMAATICRAPMAMISLIDQERQWFKASIGVSITETQRLFSICTHAITQKETLVIPDLTADHRFADNPYVTGEPHLRFYAASPLQTPEGHVLGTLCVLDVEPRHLTEKQLKSLNTLGRMVMTLMEMRRRERDQQALLDQRASDQNALQEKEDALRVQHNLLQSVISGTTDGVFVKDINSRYLLANEAIVRHMDCLDVEVVGKTDYDLFGENESIRARNHDNPVLLTGKSFTYESTQTTAAGNRTLLVTKDPRRDEEGNVIGLVGIARDITELKQTEERLRLLETAIENTDDAVIIMEAVPLPVSGQRIVYVNQAFIQSTGYASEDVLNQPPHLLYGSETDPAVVAQLHEALKNWKSLRTEIKNYRKDGTEFWVEMSVHPVANEAGWYTHWVAVQRDITVRKAAEEERQRVDEKRKAELEQRVRERTAELEAANQALEAEVQERTRIEEALRAQEGFLRQVIDTAPTMIFAKDADGRFTLANRALAELHGLTTTELVGMSNADYVKDQNEVDAFLEADRKVIETGQELQIPQELVTDADGNAHWFQTIKVPLRDAQGQVTQVLGVATDITARKALEAERERLLNEAIDRADRDPLTGLLNHRAFHRRLKEMRDQAQREGLTFSVAVMDLNNFKFFNDAYGHLAGDDVLLQAAAALTDNCRSFDTLARFGGDEFALLMPGAGINAAAAVTKRLTDALTNVHYTPPGEETRIPLSIAVGTAVYPADGLSGLELLESADARLYRAKSGVSEEDRTERLRANLKSAVAGFSMLDALVAAVDNKDRYTRSHSEDVMLYSQQIAEEMGMGTEQRHTLAIAALLHDIGKIGVPDAILRKPGRLTDDEFLAVQQHPVMGAAIVQAVQGLEATLDAVRYHHERWDGRGYPEQLSGEEIPLVARIMAVADAFSAMTTDRPYRKGLAEPHALSILEKGAGTQWDPDCVVHFLKARGVPV